MITRDRNSLLQLPEQMTILCIGAHPDDCELRCSGTAAKWRAQGHRIVYLSVTNGQSGHHISGGAHIVKRRAEEAKSAADVIGAESIVLPIADGHLEPNLPNRFLLIRSIRTVSPDIIITNRPNDYHPDHRYASQLVQDAAYMLMVPHVAPEVPAMRFNPVIFYWWDHFQFPKPFQPDIVVDIDEVFEKKMAMLDKHVSQVYEWLPYVEHILEEVPEGRKERLVWLKSVYTEKNQPPIAEQYRELLLERYGNDRGTEVVEAEAFSLCEYGMQLSKDELAELFKEI